MGLFVKKFLNIKNIPDFIMLISRIWIANSKSIFQTLLNNMWKKSFFTTSFSVYYGLNTVAESAFLPDNADRPAHSHEEGKQYRFVPIGPGGFIHQEKEYNERER